MNIQTTSGPVSGALARLNRQHTKRSAKRIAVLPPVSATPPESRWAFAIVFTSILALAAAVPFADIPLPKVPAFIPSYELALAVCDLVTAVLLFGRVTAHRSRALLALACGYLFNATIVASHALSFPGVFSETGLFGANDQTTAWLYVFWHGGFPLFVLCYAWLPEQDGPLPRLGKACCPP